MTSNNQDSLQLPSPGEAHLWFTPENTEQLAKSGLTTLSADEREKFKSFKLPKAGMRFLLGRSLLRQVLSKYLGLPPQDFEFDISPNGKPTLISPLIEGLDFNLSHDDDCVALAIVRDATIGVDVAAMHRADTALSVSRHFFSEVEKQQIDDAGPEAGMSALMLWVLKESIVKMIGASVWDGLSNLSLSFANGRIELLSQPFSDGTPDWVLSVSSHRKKFLVALAYLPNPKRSTNCITVRTHTFAEAIQSEADFNTILSSHSTIGL